MKKKRAGTKGTPNSKNRATKGAFGNQYVSKKGSK